MVEEIVISIVSCIVGLVFGSLSKKSTPIAPPPPAQVDLRPRCTCDHWFNMHEEDGGPCVVQELTSVNGTQEYVDCPCMAYLGPDPALTGMWSKTPKGQ